jgi:hypothetical protein
VKERAMTLWHETLSNDKACRIDLEQVVAVVAKKKNQVVVFLRGGHSLTVKGAIDDFAPVPKMWAVGVD